jgi:hypothetical protein
MDHHVTVGKVLNMFNLFMSLHYDVSVGTNLTVLRNHLLSHHAHEYTESIIIDEEKNWQHDEKKI